jgi:hypothetical protein
MDPSQNALAIIGPSKPRKSEPDRPLPMNGPDMDNSAETITLDLTALSTVIEPPGGTESDAPRASRFNWERLSPLAASLIFAAALGVLAGTAGTAALLPDGKPATAPVVAVATDDKRALEERVARLSAELAAIKSGIETSNKATTGQLGRIGERLDRAEKAQAEPAAKLAKIMDTLDRLERRTVAATLPPPEVTGSVSTVAKLEAKPLAVDGWRLRDFHAGRALLESRTGTLYEVGPGSNIPGLGRIEAIKRVDGRIVVSTAKGVITSAADLPRRPAYRLPPGY